MYELNRGDIFEWAQGYRGVRFHACLCDPPYHLTSIVKRFGKEGSAPAQFGTDGAYARHSGGFMGQIWDGGDIAFRAETWEAIGECLLPGAYLLAFGGTRTWHRLAVAIEDAGFEIRDTIAWIYGSGFPKSHNVGKAIDRETGAEREVVSISNRGSGAQPNKLNNHARGDTGIGYADGSGKVFEITAPTTEMAKIWDGYGSALKPAFEPIIVARKPLDGTIADNCVTYGAGALWIDGCRIEGETVPINKLEEWSGFGQKERPDYVQEMNNKGRWPANLIHDGSEEVLEGFPQNNPGCKSPSKVKRPSMYRPDQGDYMGQGQIYSDNGSAARFFYTAKVSPSERNAGLDEFEETEQGHNRFDKCAKCGGYILQNPDRPSACKCEEPERVHPKLKNNHPTLKPIALTEYLARLILPPSAYSPRRILVPFAGAGSEMIGAHQAGWEEIVGVELSEEYVKIAEARLKYWTSIPKQLELK